MIRDLEESCPAVSFNEFNYQRINRSCKVSPSRLTPDRQNNQKICTQRNRIKLYVHMGLRPKMVVNVGLQAQPKAEEDSD